MRGWDGEIGAYRFWGLGLNEGVEREGEGDKRKD